MSSSPPDVPVQSALLAREDFVKRFALGRKGRPLVRALHALLEKLPEDAPLEDRLEWLEGLGRWLLAKDRVAGLDGQEEGEDPRTARLRFLLHVAEHEQRSVGQRLARLLCSVLAETSPRALLLAGANADAPGFWAEASGRLADKLLPPPPVDLPALLMALFADRRDIAWLETVPEPLVDRFLALIRRGHPEALSPLRHALDEALLLLSTRLAALGVADDFRARCPGLGLEDSPFRQLPAACEDCLRPGPDGAPPHVPHAVLRGLIARCREAISRVFEQLEATGVSVDLVFRLELMGSALERMEQLMGLLPNAVEPNPQPTRLWARLLFLAKRSRSLRELFRTSSRQLARKIVERAGVTGEHYITASRSEYAWMYVSAAGGGFITAFTSAGKVAAAGLHLAPFLEAALFSVNYVCSFLLIAGLGFTLATKQPAMTAAAVAGTLKDAGGGFEALGSLFARTVRSQLAAALGNVSVVVPSAFAFDLCWQMAFGSHFMTPEKAEASLLSLDPRRSGTIPFAAFTGVVLWSSSVVAGWLDNWVTYRRLPDALARNRTLRRLVGRARAARFAGWLSHNTSTIGGNASLGVMLGSIPILGTFFGVPLDVRHVTLSTGLLTLSWSSLGHQAHASGLLLGAWLGIPVMLVLNVGVSFFLALWVAARAREVSLVDLRLLRALVGYALKRPWEFFFPPADPPRPPVAPAPHP